MRLEGTEQSPVCQNVMPKSTVALVGKQGVVDWWGPKRVAGQRRMAYCRAELRCLCSVCR